MTRRDTIIISVLINAGLLAILFATAWNSDDDEFGDLSATHRVMAEAQKDTERVSTPSVVGVDEVDKVLQQHAMAQRAQEVSKPQPKIVTATPSTTVVGSGDATFDPKDFVEVTVKRGDFLDKIARANGTTVEAIIKANDLVDTRLQIGQLLHIPKNDSSNKQTPDSRAEVAMADLEVYVVKRGDNPWTIARNHSVKLEELLRVNNLDDSKARSLKAGDKLKIPSTGRG